MTEAPDPSSTRRVRLRPRDGRQPSGLGSRHHPARMIHPAPPRWSTRGRWTAQQDVGVQDVSCSLDRRDDHGCGSHRADRAGCLRLGSRLCPTRSCRSQRADRVRCAGAFLSEVLHVIEVDVSHEAVKVLAEVTLVWVLFADAARVRLRDLRADLGLYTRLLAVGLPLTIAAGTLLALVVRRHGHLDLAARRCRAGTDRRSSRRSGDDRPSRSGTGPASAERRERTQRRHRHPGRDGCHRRCGDRGQHRWPSERGRRADRSCHRPRGWRRRWRCRRHGDAHGATPRLGVGGPRRARCAGPGIGCLRGHVWLGGNGFVAAFVAGLAFGNSAGRGGAKEVFYVEQSAGLVSLVTWLFFGAVAVPTVFEQADWQVVCYAVLSLTVVRMVPVALALIGSGMSLPTVAFIGWFGPRGLASIIFALVALEDLHGEADRAVAIIGMTVLLSVVAHGVTAKPLASRYGATVDTSARPPGKEPQAPPVRGLLKRHSHSAPIPPPGGASG